MEKGKGKEKEGRHGMVRTRKPWSLPMSLKSVNQLDSPRRRPPTARIATKVSLKPTSHSNLTSKNGHDHEDPDCKYTDKAKGTHKLKNGSDIGLVESREDVDGDCNPSKKNYGLLDDGLDKNGLMGDPNEMVSGDGDANEDVDVDCNPRSFYDVGYVWEQVDNDDGWCLVGNTKN